MYQKITITPSKAQSSLRSLAHGKEPGIPIHLLADYILAQGALSAPPKDDFVRFAERLHGLKDCRAQSEGGRYEQA